ncbi:[formate-C-acetyltransferase]-activating enzyme [Vibrio sp. HA2012]|uniref:[formate-C-acetyltransferase]-activating enzyme n=1 Tax=Vibrio sp. HA2012 TaxID=1971595 RepID=UPI000C2C5285|nr:[formate-C-acetyltransferase]-activating enzyme [Vibrio sp. HA2012]PJC85035.1 [formate-C-acetyltransferase]-activating enzyme [Vibrio sp. HA2012]
MTLFEELLMNCEQKARETGRIFNIQRYSLHDGEGIRTVVFFKGCPLKCPWCSNPESRSLQSQVIRREVKCLHCSQCDMDVDDCPGGALEIVGRDMSVEEILAEIEKDDVFFRTSGGGVTLSGGEVLMQAPFAIMLLKRLKQLGYRTAIETSGQGNIKQLLRLGALCDEVLFDFKIMDSERSRQVTGIDLERVLAGFSQLAGMGINVIPRLPLIPGYTLSLTNVDKILAFLRPFQLRELHILPFHQYGASKYETFNLEYAFKDVPVPGTEEIASVCRHIEAYGYTVIIGG